MSNFQSLCKHLRRKEATAPRGHSSREEQLVTEIDERYEEEDE